MTGSKKVRGAFVRSLAVLAVAAVAAAGVTAQSPGGWQTLFNGKDLSGWTVAAGRAGTAPANAPAQWRVEDGVLVGGVGGGRGSLVSEGQYKDFELALEWKVAPGGNSGVYLQNRYEIQVLDGDKTKHGMGAVINESESPYHAYNGLGKWNAYDIVFRAARFKDGKRVEKAMVTMYFNGKKVHDNVQISQVWGGPRSGAAVPGSASGSARGQSSWSRACAPATMEPR